MADQVLSRTLNQKFDTVFEEVTHQESLNLLNRNDLKLFCLDIETNQFNYGPLVEFLEDNLGMYVFSILLGLLMNKIGYKKTLVSGLAVVALGFLFCYFGIGSYAGESGMIEVPTDASAAKALTTSVFYTFLLCMACVAIGVVMLQLVANPYVMVLGSPEKGAFRMTISQAINSVATVFAPMFVSTLLLRTYSPVLSKIKLNIPAGTVANTKYQNIFPSVDGCLFIV